MISRCGFQFQLCHLWISCNNWRNSTDSYYAMNFLFCLCCLIYMQCSYSNLLFTDMPNLKSRKTLDKILHWSDSLSFAFSHHIIWSIVKGDLSELDLIRICRCMRTWLRVALLLSIWWSWSQILHLHRLRSSKQYCPNSRYQLFNADTNSLIFCSFFFGQILLQYIWIRKHIC